MRCICGNKTIIVNTRGNDYNVYRLHRCPICNREFVTKETKIDYKEGKKMLHKIHATRYGEREPFKKKNRSGRRLG